MKERCVVLGGGGHAKVVIDAVQLDGTAEIVAVVDVDPSRWGTRILGVPIRGGDAELPALIAEGVNRFVMGLAGTGDNEPRRRLFELASAQGLTPLTVRHPAASCSSHATLGAGSVVLAMAIVNAGTVIGRNVIVNSGAIVEHDCEIGDHVHIAPGACLAGGVRVDVGAHVGAGAVVRQRLRIGAGAVIGMGAAVTRDVPAGAVVAGVPAAALERASTRLSSRQ